MRLIAAVSVIALSASCSSPEGGGELHTRVEAASLPSVDVRLLLQPSHQRDGDRYLRAAEATLKMVGEWLGAFPAASLTLIDPGWRDDAVVLDDAVRLDRTPWRSAATRMAPELATARAISRRFWSHRIDTTALPSWFVEGLAEYVARRAVAPLFEFDNQPPGYAFLEERYFGGFVPRFVRVRLMLETDGDPIPAYRARPDGGATAPADSAAEAASLAGKTVIALATLERWLGRPAFDEVVADFVRSSVGRTATIADFERSASDISGQNLSWFFDAVFESSNPFDYGVSLFTSEPLTDGAFVTVVVARRLGEAQFTGASASPIGSFESGRGVPVRVTFEDGQQRTDYWDGRARERTFTYRSPVRAVAAAVDPDRTILLDLNQTNNSWTLAPRTNAAASRWAAHWLLWLENALLNFATLV